MIPAVIPLPAVRNAAYRRFLTVWGRCAVCLEAGCDPAHGPVNGTGSKGPDSGCIPLCRLHHDEQHALNWPAFEQLHEIDREQVAARWWRRFETWRVAA